ncbi:MAG: polymer-forming cytoskeletal protein [Bacteroidales bacterium]|nr:polymer-forming cytoskeletal protein [Bacteroidales bacterium]
MNITATKQELPNVNSVSRISAGTKIKGEITSEFDIRIDGEFDGRIFSKGRVVIGDKANVTGTIICNNIDLWGKLEGSVIVKEVLTLKDGCSLKGDIKTNKIQVEIGAVLNAVCATISQQEYDKLAAAGKPQGAPQQEVRK